MKIEISYTALASTNTPHWVLTGIANTILQNGQIPNYDGTHRSCKSTVARFLANPRTFKSKYGLDKRTAKIVMFGLFDAEEGFIMPGEMSHIIVANKHFDPICDSNTQGRVLAHPNGVVEYEYVEGGHTSTQRMFFSITLEEFWKTYVYKGEPPTLFPIK